MRNHLAAFFFCFIKPYISQYGAFLYVYMAFIE